MSVVDSNLHICTYDIVLPVVKEADVSPAVLIALEMTTICRMYEHGPR